MGLLDSLLGGGGQQQEELQNFVRRYEQGPPSEGYSDQEVVDRYDQVARHVPQDTYRQSAEEAFARLTPEERQEFATWLRQRAQQRNVNVPTLQQGGLNQLQEPSVLARAASELHQQQPGLLTQLLGGGGSSTSGSGSLLDNPVAKAALAGIAAMAVKNMMGRAQSGR